MAFHTSLVSDNAGTERIPVSTCLVRCMGNVWSGVFVPSGQVSIRCMGTVCSGVWIPSSQVYGYSVQVYGYYLVRCGGGGGVF